MIGGHFVEGNRASGNMLRMAPEENIMGKKLIQALAGKSSPPNLPVIY
jgi:hypothetical protein